MRGVLALVLAGALVGCGATTVTAAGISVPSGPDLDRFGLQPRCIAARDSSCTDRALEIAAEILRRLGPAEPPAAVPESGDPAGAFTVQVDRDPPFEWRSSDGSGGTTVNAMIDLEPLLAGRGAAVVRIAGDDPAYPVAPDLARQLVDALFISGG